MKIFNGSSKVIEQVNVNDLALKHISIKGNVIGRFSTFEIEQVYLNETHNVLEVNYTFPISDTATVIGFISTIGNKVIKGKVMEKSKAEETYRDNIVKGNSAYLMEQETKNIFNIRIGKIAPNEEVKIKINYIDKLDIVDDVMNLLIPTLITPKYASKITKDKVYGNPLYTVDFNINISDVVNVSEITSVTHSVVFSKKKLGYDITVKDCNLDKDFKLGIKLSKGMSSNAIKALTKDNKEIIYLSFMPEIEDKYEDKEREYIFLVDVSGSMSGRKLDETKKAVKQCLTSLDFGDKFNIIAFESNYVAMDIDALEYNETNLEKANLWVDNLKTLGGTEIMDPIKFSLYEKDVEKVVLLFTDGQVGNEKEIVNYVRENINNSRLFAFGIDSNVNTSFIREISEVGNGKAEFIHPNEKIDDKIIRTFARIQSPLLSNITIDCGNNVVIDQIKEETVLFNYEFYNAFIKVEKLVDDITLSGMILGKEYKWTIKKEDITTSDTNIELIWIKQLISRLEKYEFRNGYKSQVDDYTSEIIKLSEEYNVISRFTSFIAVNERNEKLDQIAMKQDTILHRDSTMKTMARRSISAISGMFMEESSDHIEYNVTKPQGKIIDYMALAMDMINLYTIKNIDKIIQNKDTYKYILLALFYSNNKYNTFDHVKFISYLIVNKDIVNADKQSMRLLIEYYNIIDPTVKDKVLQVMDDKYKKIVLTNIQLNALSNIITKAEFEELVNTNNETEIEKIITYYVYTKIDDDSIPEIFRRKIC